MTLTPFEIRGINVCESLSRHTPAQVERLLQRLLDWNMNTLVVLPAYGYRLHETMIRRFCARHDIRLVQYLYTTLAFTPDAPVKWLAVDDQQQPYCTHIGAETRLCISQPGVIDRFREGARRYIQTRLAPGDELLLGTADGYLLCRCKRCRSMGPIEQWQPLLETAVDEIRRSGVPLRTHFIAYVGRFSLPKDMAVFEHIDAVMFDTHLRFRTAPLGEPHPLGVVERNEGVVEPRALNTPMNCYLLDRLREWRQAYRGKLYVFENLMIQATFSLPQPNTPALLRDLATYRELGIDGVVYEAFEPGIGAFVPQLDVLSAALSGKTQDYTPTELERTATASPGRPVRSRALAYLFSDALDSPERMASVMPSPTLAKLAWMIRQYLPAPTWNAWRQVARFALDHRDELDWLYIAYRLATYLPESERPQHLTDAQQRLFETAKPWDYLEPLPDPLSGAQQVIESLLHAS